jgi:hypothetical protein
MKALDGMLLSSKKQHNNNNVPTPCSKFSKVMASEELNCSMPNYRGCASII